MPIVDRSLKGDVAAVLRFVVARVTRPQKLIYHGITVPVAATPELDSLRRKLLRGLHEAGEIAAVEALLRPEDVVLEIGAGTGVLTAIIARRAKRVVSFEPNPALKRSAYAVFAANGVIPEYRTAAVGIEARVAKFYVGRGSKAGESSSLIDRGDAREITTDVVAFEHVLREVCPSFLMIDAEGAERELLAVPLPDDVRAVCAEFHPHVIGDEAVTDVIRGLFSQGFTLFLDHSHHRVLALAR